MGTQWYKGDWFTSFMVAIALILGIIGNYLYHGGHLVW
jgi:hypothetical protein